ncbi:uncharacterized protein PV09_01983 [Verruconis gallopava]|uniref:GIY-YIG domain-containing protein n=1 Tax=Verruconis gallopava TaxID=253628 RepID=A0A0D1XWH0_9PEZI|nr:uncharacterized protein PV09_01983 [Verruconis gallopava]KIW07106.1 hypothetical protein PV09_01983 [Verruconis gallopava]
MDTKPIPAFYCCYLLRSTVQRGFNYIGSTPNMLRRIKQHNGQSPGGAKKTSYRTLKPWEVTCIVHGFPSKIAALQFEWAWQHTYKSRHAREEDEGVLENLDFRVSPKSGKARRRKPTSHARSLTDRIMNLHILLRARSFRAWPLSVRFFCTDVFRVWNTVHEKLDTRLPETIDVTLDKDAVDHYSKTEPLTNRVDYRPNLPLHGVENLDFGYSSLKPLYEKSKLALACDNIACAVCAKNIGSLEELLVVCPHDGCEAVSHLHCLSAHFLSTSNDHGSGILPTAGCCPSCSRPAKWITLMKVLTLRTRGEKEIAKLIRKPRVRRNGNENATETAIADDEFKTIEEIEEDEDASIADLEDFESIVVKEALEDNMPSPTGINTPDRSKVVINSRRSSQARERSKSVAEETGWSDAEVLE